MRGVLDTTGQIFQRSKSPDTFSFVIISGMFWQNLAKIGQICTPYEFAESACTPPKSKCNILAHRGSQTTHATQGDYLVS